MADPGPSLTVNDLIDILTETTEGLIMLPSKCMDQVYPQIFIGDRQSASLACTCNPAKITHVLNAAAGPLDRSHVQSDAAVFERAGICLKCIEADDTDSFLIKDHFQEATDFIEKAVADNGKVLVHCVEGVSRSAAFVLAFLMFKRKMPIQEAVRQVRKHREVIPNDAFLQQLIEVNQQLLSEGFFASN